MCEQWIIAMAVLLTIFHPELSESSSNYALAKGIHIKRVDKNATAFVSCIELTEGEKLISIHLHKEETEVHSTNMRNKTSQSWQRFQVFVQNSSVSYMILSTEVNDTGIYSCKVLTETRKHMSQTILLIKDAQHSTESSLTCPTEQKLALIIGSGIIAVYNLLMTILGVYFGWKLKNTEPPENIYTNTRLREFRHR